MRAVSVVTSRCPSACLPRLRTVDFYSAYAHGFARVAAVTMPIAVADPATNARTVIDQVRACHDEGVAVAVFPELCLSGYAIDDLFLQETLLSAVEQALVDVAAATESLRPVVVVGAPYVYRNRVLNAAFVISGGEVLGIVPKSNLPTYREFYERRWFAPGDDIDDIVRFDGIDVPISPRLLFRASDLRDLIVHVEVCEDMWVPVPPSAQAALAGATVLVNLSGSPITVGRA